MREFKQILKNCGYFHKDGEHNIKQKNISKYSYDIENQYSIENMEQEEIQKLKAGKLQPTFKLS